MSQLKRQANQMGKTDKKKFKQRVHFKPFARAKCDRNPLIFDDKRLFMRQMYREKS